MVRNTDCNRFQEKMRKGTAQLFFFGWNADYPDPENFLFLLHGPQAHARTSGENAANYANPEFDRLFERMKRWQTAGTPGADRPHGRNPAPRRALGLRLPSQGLQPPHAWVYNRKPNKMANNGLKYQRIDPQLRERNCARVEPAGRLAAR